MREMVLLGLRVLIDDKRRLFAMSASVAVGVVIMFLQLGMLEGALDAQAIVARFVRGDIMVMNQARVDLQHWDRINSYELAQIAAAPGVTKVTPVYEDHVALTDLGRQKHQTNHRLRFSARRRRPAARHWRSEDGVRRAGAVERVSL